MIRDLKPYPAYKDSGVEWLGKVPEHWEVRRIKTLFRETDERNGNDGGLLLSLTRTRGIVLQSEAVNRIASVEDLSKYKVCKSGDLVLNRMQAWSGMFAVSGIDGVISPDYSVFQPKAAIEVHYFEALFKTPVLVDEFAKRSKGIGSGFNRLYTPDFGAVLIASPPLNEQTAIVRFLDYTDQRIRRVIRARQRRIKLLEEYKQALIHQAVTGQIDVRTGQPYPAYKDSGVEWLGQVPEHWGVVAGRGCFVERKQPNIGLMETTVLSLSYGRIVVKPVEKLRGLVPASFETYQIVDPGDIVCRPTDLQNDQNSLRFGLVRNRGIITSAYMCFRTSGRLDSHFGYLLLHAYDVKKIFYGLGSGLRQNLDWRDFKRLSCLVPPLPEQTAIAEYLDAQTANIDAAIEASRREIDLLREYRTRLISDVVTGKVDVRDVAPQLPEEPPEQEVEWMDRNETAEAETADDDAAAEAFSKEEVET